MSQTVNPDCLSEFSDAKALPIPDKRKDIPFSAIGRLAVQLREYMCNGEGAVMLRPDVRDVIYQAIAVVGGQGSVRILQQYKRWVQKLAQTEFADELVVRDSKMI